MLFPQQELFSLGVLLLLLLSSSYAPLLTSPFASIEPFTLSDPAVRPIIADSVRTSTTLSRTIIVLSAPFQSPVATAANRTRTIVRKLSQPMTAGFDARKD